MFAELVEILLLKSIDNFFVTESQSDVLLFELFHIDKIEGFCFFLGQGIVNLNDSQFFEVSEGRK